MFRLLHHAPLVGENLTSSFEILKIENIFLENLWVQAQTLKRGPTSVGSSRVIVQARVVYGYYAQSGRLIWGCMGGGLTVRVANRPRQGRYGWRRVWDAVCLGGISHAINSILVVGYSVGWIWVAPTDSVGWPNSAGVSCGAVVYFGFSDWFSFSFSFTFLSSSVWVIWWFWRG